MKEFTVTIKYSHESFGGYTHNDGTEDFKVMARTHASARKKALKLANTKNVLQKEVIAIF